MKTIPTVLTIAGSDSGGGAGIQADLKTFTVFKVFGTSAVTAITAQNTKGVQGIFPLPPDFVGMQIDSVMTDIGPKVWKIGMLANRDIIKMVSEKISGYKIKKVILDPVMMAKGGQPLLASAANLSLIEKLIPKSYVITPNIHEAEAIVGFKIGNVNEMKKAAFRISQMGAANTVIKGGHLPNESYAVDVLYDGKSYYIFNEKRINTKNTHGTGCTFSSAITACIANGENVFNSVLNAKKYVYGAILASKNLHIGKGHGPLNQRF